MDIHGGLPVDLVVESKPILKPILSLALHSNQSSDQIHHWFKEVPCPA